MTGFMGSASVLRLDRVSFGYRSTEEAVVSRASFELRAGELALLVGATGSGKSSLLKLLTGLTPQFTGGWATGRIWLSEEQMLGKPPHDFAPSVGYVSQHPELGFVAETVLDEICFGMEQLGTAREEMISHSDRMLGLLGVESLRERSLETLSGGEQQRVAIAAALAGEKKLLLLDEPTSALDPDAAKRLLALLRGLATELGIAILLAEHRIERAVEQVDSLILMGGDGSVSKGLPAEMLQNYPVLPPVLELSRSLKWLPLPILATSAREQWEKTLSGLDASQGGGPGTGRGNAGATEESSEPSTEGFESAPAITVSGLNVEHGKTRVLSRVSFELTFGEVLCVMGENGTGKSSLLWAIWSAMKQSRAEISFAEGAIGGLVFVPQQASDLLFLPTLADELAEADLQAGAAQTSTAKIFERLTMRVDPAFHPHDLSAGQQLALALAVQLVKGSKVLLLDEPTRGLDYQAKSRLAKLLTEQARAGHAILLATHDIEFAAGVANRVALLAGGEFGDATSARQFFGAAGAMPSEMARLTSGKSNPDGAINLEAAFSLLRELGWGGDPDG